MKNEGRSIDSDPGWTTRNLWAVSAASFFMDVASEMTMNLVPLLLSNVLGASTAVIGLVEGVSQATANLVQVGSGWLSDRLRARKWLAVAGYALSAASKPTLYVAGTWGLVLGARWIDRVGKGIRTAPRDALVADSTDRRHHGAAFGFQRAADTAGAVIGLGIALAVVVASGGTSASLARGTFQTIALVSIVPATLAVLSLAVGARDVPPPVPDVRAGPGRLDGSFLTFVGIVALFGLGNASDAFLVLRAQERGLRVADILLVLIAFNVVYALVSAPAGALSDRLGRRRMIVVGWLVYAAVYFGFALARAPWHVMAPVPGLRRVLRRHVRRPQGGGRGSRAGRAARHRVRALQHGPRDGEPRRLAHRGRAVAGRRKLAGLRPLGAVPLRRHAGAGRGDPPEPRAGVARRARADMTSRVPQLYRVQTFHGCASAGGR